MRTAVLDLRAQRRRKGRRRWIVGVLFLGALVWGANTYLFARPATAALAADSSFSKVVLAAHLRYYVDPTTLILDLRRAQVADPADLFGALLRAIKALDDATWMPGQVVLQRGGVPVYTVGGAALSRLAYDYSVAKKPAPVLLKLVEALRLPDGRAVPPMPVTAAAGRWASGR